MIGTEIKWAWTCNGIRAHVLNRKKHVMGCIEVDNDAYDAEHRVEQFARVQVRWKRVIGTEIEWAQTCNGTRAHVLNGKKHVMGCVEVEHDAYNTAHRVGKKKWQGRQRNTPHTTLRVR